MSNLTSDKERPAAANGPVISERQVKQGRTGTHTFVILLISTVLALVLVFALWLLMSANRPAPAAPTSKAAAARAFDAGPSQPIAGPAAPH